MTTETTVLQVSTSTSRGAETYGYTIVRLDDTSTGKRYRCMGGGYDMVGTVFAAWLQDTHQGELQAIAKRAHYIGTTVNDDRDSLYGMRLMPSGVVSLDGGCGLSSMERIAKAIGLSVRTLFTPRGRTSGFVVSAL